MIWKKIKSWNNLYYFDSTFLEYNRIPIKRLLGSTIILMLTILIFTYIFGKAEGWILRNSEVNLLKSQIVKQENIITSLQDSIKNRDFLEYVVWKNYNLEHFETFRNLPDSIFYLMFEEVEKNKIPHTIFFRLIDRESGFRFIPNSEGSGAMGYMQVMPHTFQQLSHTLSLPGGHTPTNNIRVGAYYLRISHVFWLAVLKDDKKAWEYALAEYAVGRGGMQVKDENNRVVGYYIPESTKSGIERVLKFY